MRKVGFGLLLLVAGLFVSVLPAAEGDHDVTTNGEVRVRWEHQENYFDAQDDPPGDDDSQSFFPYRALIGVTGNFSENVVGHIETQAFGWFGSDTQSDSPTSPPDQGFNLSIDDSEVDLFQGWVELREAWGSNWNLRAGRQTHVLTNELHLGDADFYNGTKFDGVRAMADFESWDLDLFYYQTVENFAGGFPFNDDDVYLAGATAGFDIGDSGQSVTPYLLFLRDGDYDGSGGKLLTLGAQWGRPVPEDMSGSPFDWSLEAAFQSGDSSPNNAIASLQDDFGGSIVEGWFGYNWGSDESHHRVHVGALMASGDDDPLDDSVDSYVPLFPDDHAHNRLGDLDLFGTGFGNNLVGDSMTGGMSNVNDWNVGYDYTGGAHHFMVALHQLSLAEETQLLLTEDGIGTEFDASYDYAYSDNVDLQLGAAMLQTDDALDQFVGGVATPASTDSILRAWWQVRLHWN